jgi:hypothetical protein
MFRPPLKGTTPGDTNVSIQVPEIFIYLFIYLSPSLFGSVRFDQGYFLQFFDIENSAIFLFYKSRISRIFTTEKNLFNAIKKKKLLGKTKRKKTGEFASVISAVVICDWPE